MKILLLGDYSALYKNLKEGLVELGHDAVVASYGDGWKNIPRDIDLGSGGGGFLGKIKRKLNPIVNVKKLVDYDVVQYINAFYFYHPMLPNKQFIRFLQTRNNKFFLSAAGDDSYFWRNGRSRLRYSPFEDFLKYDLKASDFYMSSDKSYYFNKWLASSVNGIIPIMHEYEVSYRDHAKLKRTIPIPINLERVSYSDNVVGRRLVVFHGLNRYGFKGTRHVEKAFKLLADKYPNDLELVIDGGMPLDEYLQFMRRVNVVIDQTNSYSLGVNGVYAMAMGKVVLGGAEPESLISLGVSDTPVINILPDYKDIISKIEFLLENRSKITCFGYESRLFAEQTHGHIEVASKYLETWCENE